MSAIDNISSMDPAEVILLSTAAATRAERPENMPAVGKDGPKKEKRKVVRRDPEKRRQQNIQAQKKYREKLRKRLDDLENLAASVAKSRETETKVVAGAASPATSVSDQTPSPEETSPESPEWSLSHFPGENGSQQGAQSHTTIPLDVLAPTAAEDSSMDWSLWDSTTSIDPSYLTVANYGRSDYQKSFGPTTYVDCGCPVRHIEVRPRTLGDHGSGYVLIRMGDSRVVLPDPYLNHMRIEAMCIVSAVWENCLQLGLSEVALCDDDGQSAFYRPGPSMNLITSGNSTEAVDSVVRTVQSIWKTLKPDIRPIKEQVLIPHHPCLDILPFPTLRRNILKRLVFFDEDDFYNDCINGGLICWGGAGLSKRDRQGATGKASTGAAWDHRSWEAKAWFLRKHWIILGGEDGELVRQSEWWRSMRGEEVDIWTSEPSSGPGSNQAQDLFDINNVNLGVLAGVYCHA